MSPRQFRARTTPSQGLEGDDGPCRKKRFLLNWLKWHTNKKPQIQRCTTNCDFCIFHIAFNYSLLTPIPLQNLLPMFRFLGICLLSHYTSWFYRQLQNTHLSSNTCFLIHLKSVYNALLKKALRLSTCHEEPKNQRGITSSMEKYVVTHHEN